MFYPQDMLHGVLIGCALYLLGFVDASRVYHSIRGQSAIKLYVIFNVMEMCDKLLCSFGLDILESIQATSFLSREVKNDPEGPNSSSSSLHPIMHLSLAIAYLCIIIIPLNL